MIPFKAPEFNSKDSIVRTAMRMLINPGITSFVSFPVVEVVDYLIYDSQSVHTAESIRCGFSRD